MIDFTPPSRIQKTVSDIHRFINDDLKPIERDLAEHLTNEHLCDLSLTRETAWAEQCRPNQAAIPIGILGDEVTVNQRSISVLFFLSNDSDAGEGITMSYRCTKTNSEGLQPPTEETCRQHTDQERCTERSRHDGVLKTPLLGDFMTQEALINHPHFCPVAQNVFGRWRIGQRSDFIADLNISEGLGK